MTVHTGTAGVDLSQVAAGPQNPRKSREVRVGLVMYGGVSLAIYINGVAREFFRAVHGNGVYKLLKRLTDADIVVDILSGTSAGGINGIFLGYALANGKDFAGMAGLWREHGDIARLLRDPDTLPDPCPSALDSDGYYHTQLRKAFAQLEDYRGDGDEPSRLNELDLFVTGTNIDGQIYTTFDDHGHAIDVKDHRAVFLLKHRAGRKTPFAPTDTAGESDPTHEALARLSRLTSAFPAAFQSVVVQDDQWQDADSPAHASLRQWGLLKQRTFFIDGGVLDNKPFSYTTREIARRAASRKVDRYLFYVEPDPEQFDEKVRKVRTESPSFLETAYAGKLGIPSYESISDDLQLIAEQNARVQQYRTLADSITRTILAGDCQDDPACAATVAAHRDARLLQISRRAIRGIVKERQAWVPGGDASAARKREAAATLMKSFSDFVDLARPGNEEGSLTLRDFDIFYYERRLARLEEYLYDKLDCSPDARESELNDAITLLLQRVCRARKLLEVVHHHMDKVVDESAFDWEAVVRDTDSRGQMGAKIWAEAQTQFRLLLGLGIDLTIKDPTMPPEELTRISNALSARRSKPREEPGEFSSVLVYYDAFFGAVIRDMAVSLPTKLRDEVLKIWSCFERIDALLFPLQMLSGVGEQAEIKTVRISPIDAKLGFSNRSLQDKVAGDDLGHFSGFFKRSWRSNDILWGRLDAVCQLTECLLSQVRVEALFGTGSRRAAMRKLLTAGVTIAKLVDETFPSALPQSRAALTGWLTDLTDVNPATADPARAAATVKKHVELLVGLAQLEIIEEELPEVYKDQVSEALEWENAPSIHAATIGADAAVAISRIGQIQPAPMKPPTASMLRARLAAVLRKPKNAATSPPTAKDTALGRYFEQSYKVGSENIRKHVPPTVLIETIFTALLVVKKALLSSLTKEARAVVERSAIFRLALDLPLRVGRALAVAVRREARLTAILLAAFTSAAILALFLAFNFRTPILYDKQIQWLWVGLLVVLPIAGLTIVARVTLKQRLFVAAKWAAAASLIALLYVLVKDDSITYRHKGKEWRLPRAETTAAPSVPETVSAEAH